ncbi:MULTISPECIES: ABC transporter permease [unclassified Paracoccus (in: a-proteobacteria)]|uniref:ABC transporter permease n=1 Tax=unclassified Paracoccus (in: a-proteobacteria) TaxID=2688777 RepID=UPI001E523130|nr:MULTISPECIES: ABC transporter permease subunit [unclassified Paracoccus (in: a-proteobacteria)]UXU76666.1 ABC transporter permease subunit [Paracoccus sp. SMMA_5]UXU82556.1 ABC transporter permease subunit [Paracoccus sp. SMMA_5_TC]
MSAAIPAWDRRAWCSFCIFTRRSVVIAYSFNENRIAGVWTRFSFKWYGAALNHAPLVGALKTSLIVAAVATLILFSLIVAHSAFCTPFAFLTIRARLQGMSLDFEEAATDLYASRWKTFRRVTLPLILPDLFAGALLVAARGRADRL